MNTLDLSDIGHLCTNVYVVNGPLPSDELSPFLTATATNALCVPCSLAFDALRSSDHG